MEWRGQLLLHWRCFSLKEKMLQAPLCALDDTSACSALSSTFLCDGRNLN